VYTTTVQPAPRSRSQCAVCVLRHRGLCAGVDDLDLDGSAALEAAHGATRVYDAGDVIYQQGDRSDQVFNLITGWVAIHRDFADGRRQIVEFLQPEAMFGMEAAGDLMGHGATALTNASVCPIGTAKLDDLRRRVPSLNERFIWLLQRGGRRLREAQATLGQGSAKERIAALLNQLAAIATGRAPMRAGAQVRIPLTQRLIAEATGLTSIHVNRVLRLLRESGVVEFQASQLRIVSPDKLRALAEPEDDSAARGSRLAPDEGYEDERRAPVTDRSRALLHGLA